MRAKSQTPSYWFLDNVAGWRAAHTERLTLTQPDGYWRLDPLPRSATLPLDRARQDAEFICPSAIGVDRCRGILIADAAASLIKKIPPGIPTSPLPSIGRPGKEPGQFTEPRGVAWLPRGALAIADTANHRIQVLASSPFTVLQLWGATDATGQPKSGPGQLEFNWPWGMVVDERCVVWIADRGNHRIQKIQHDGTWLGEIGATVLRDPTRLTLGPGGLLAVVDRAPGAVVLFPPDGSPPMTLDKPTQARSVAFDPQGNLYVGSATGLIYRLAPDRSGPGGFRLVGAGASGMDGEVVDLSWNTDEKLLALVREQEDGQKVRLWEVDPEGASAGWGLLITTALDSKLDRGAWHRIFIKAAIPQGTTLQVESFTDDSMHTDAEISDPAFSEWKICGLASHRQPGPPPGVPSSLAPTESSADETDDADCLVQSDPGRYLWIRLTFRSSCKESPEARWLKAFFPRESYLRYLPAVYQQDEASRHFLDRFLCIFQTDLDDLDALLDDLWLLFDPASVRVKFLRWLASWVALDIEPDWTPGKIRQALKQAIALYKRRGTLPGLQDALTMYSTLDWATVIEHFRLRRWSLLRSGAWLGGGARLWSPDIYHQVQVGAYSQIARFQIRSFPEPNAESVGWGANKFSVFFPADPYSVAAALNQISRVVEREKPAHTQAQLCPVFPRFRVGVQATIGVDSRIGGISHLVLNQLSTLNYNSILGCTETEREIRSRGNALRPQIGATTRLS